MNKVTIGFCVKNSESTVRKALMSIIEQDYPSKQMEILVVDGESEDKTLSIVRKVLEKSPFSYKVFNENNGLGYARQLVFKESRGDYIIWVDGDMILPSDFVIQQVQYMKENPFVGIAKAGYGLMDEKSIVAFLENIELAVSFNSQGDVGSRPLGTAGCIYRISALRDVGGFDERFKGVGEDMEIENRIRKKGWPLHVSSAVFCELRRKTWKSLWKEYFWHGQGGYQLLKRDNVSIPIVKFHPLVALVTELKRMGNAYKLSQRKTVFLLPLHYIFKRIAWIIGFTLSGFTQKKSLI